MAQNNLIRFRKEDYPETETWWDRAMYALNLVIDYLAALAVTITDIQTALTLRPVVQTTTITFTSSGTSTTNPETNTYNFVSSLPSEPKQLLVHATNNSNPAITTPVFASWYYSKGTVFINAISGLSNSTKYYLTISIF